MKGEWQGLGDDERERESSLASSIALSLSQPCGIPHNWVQHACRQNDRSPPRPAPTRRNYSPVE
eukprot:365468-Chlamydomonas_euryale.AAC.5